MDTGYLERIGRTRDQRDMGQEGCCYMSRAVLMQWRDGICVMRLSRRVSGVKFKFKKSKLLVGVCYRVPDATEECKKYCECQEMYKLLERANKETSLIMGDFNYHVDWEHSEGEREQCRLFLDFIEASFMQ